MTDSHCLWPLGRGGLETWALLEKLGGWVCGCLLCESYSFASLKFCIVKCGTSDETGSGSREQQPSKMAGLSFFTGWGHLLPAQHCPGIGSLGNHSLELKMSVKLPLFPFPKCSAEIWVQAPKLYYLGEEFAETYRLYGSSLVSTVWKQTAHRLQSFRGA